MFLTEKQIDVLLNIAKKNTDGSLVDLDQVLDRINFETSKASIQFCIRSLVSRELIEKAGMEKRRCARRVLLKATELGVAMVGLGPKPTTNTLDAENDIIELGFEDL